MGSGVEIDLVDVVRMFPGGVKAVDGVSLGIRAGEFLTLLGPSGSGKTTSLMMIAGFERPDRGEVLIGGRLVSHLPPHKRDLGVVFQNYALFPHLTVFDNIAYPLRIRRRGQAEIRERVRGALQMVKLEGFGARYPGQLSGGQQQRIALARALVFEPRVLLMDEPLGALDKRLREHMQLEIKALHDSLGITMIYVTHDQTEALVMSDRIAVMQHGRIAQIGTPDEIYERPVSRFVAEFIGESNLLTALVERGGDGIVAVLCGGNRLAAAGLERFHDGDQVRLVLRPEKVGMGREWAGASNRMPGKIEDVIFFGETRQYRVRLTDGLTAITVRVPNSSLMAGFHPGDDVMLGFDRRDCVALPCEDASR